MRRRIFITTAVTAAAVAALPGAASAAEVKLTFGDKSAVLSITDRLSQANNITIERPAPSADGIRVRDAVPIQLPTGTFTGCQLESSTVALCSGASVGRPILDMSANTANGNDTVIENANLRGTISTGFGNDTIVQTDFAHHINGGGGFDVVSYANRTSGVGVTLNSAFTSPRDDGIAGEHDEVNAVERVIGTGFNDLISETVNGMGDKSVTGGNGDDYVEARDGNDVLDGGLGADYLLGNEGADRILARDGVTDRRIHCGGGTDVAEIDLVDPAPEACETVSRSPKNTTTVAVKPLAGKPAARVTCSRSAQAACRGTLSLQRRDSTKLASRRFSLPRGASKVVRLKTATTGKVIWHSAEQDAQGRPMTVDVLARLR